MNEHQACIQIFQAFISISHANSVQIQAGKKRAVSSIPLGPDVHVQRIVRDAGDTIQLYKKVLGAKELLRIEEAQGPPNYELEHRR